MQCSSVCETHPLQTKMQWMWWKLYTFLWSQSVDLWFNNQKKNQLKKTLWLCRPAKSTWLLLSSVRSHSLINSTWCCLTTAASYISIAQEVWGWLYCSEPFDYAQAKMRDCTFQSVVTLSCEKALLWPKIEMRLVILCFKSFIVTTVHSLDFAKLLDLHT